MGTLNLKNCGIIHAQCANERLAEWQSANKETIISPGDFVKKKFVVGDKSEWAWVEVASVNGNTITGRLDNHLIYSILKLNDTITLDRSEIAELYPNPNF